MSSSIEWTDETWNPLRGCSRVSPGCEHCYAEREAGRPILSGAGRPYEGLVRLGPFGPRWADKSSGLQLETLPYPLTWPSARMIFVCSMSDLFFERHSFEAIAAVFGVMAACQRHVFQVLTKRPGQALRFYQWLEQDWPGVCGPLDRCLIAARNFIPMLSDPPVDTWPLPNVWTGVSVEDQRHAEVRVPQLLELPAALRWVSYEPALELVDFRPWLEGPRLDWIVCGGESGRGARPFNLAWPRDLIGWCAAAEVPLFLKQMGARPHVEPDQWLRDCEGWVGPRPHARPVAGSGLLGLSLKSRKGGDPAEWPPELRVRQWPRTNKKGV